jgi:hypothetical protein
MLRKTRIVCERRKVLRKTILLAKVAKDPVREKKGYEIPFLLLQGLFGMQESVTLR